MLFLKVYKLYRKNEYFKKCIGFNMSYFLLIVGGKDFRDNRIFVNVIGEYFMVSKFCIFLGKINVGKSKLYKK